jgi:spore photoproduct lyase
LIHQRFPQSRVAAQEMVRAPDGKLRYYKSIRVEMYGRLCQYLSETVPEMQPYLCMESPRLWQEVFGFTPTGADLAHWLDQRVGFPD